MKKFATTSGGNLSTIISIQSGPEKVISLSSGRHQLALIASCRAAACGHRTSA
uniref:Uncharacterized protein n=1 Tax=Arundo donax TaxID=35708 RepID=A0A0A9ARM6_ARUDO